ncbi:MAG: ATP-binding protein [Pseudomonadota bacterium]
MDDRSIFSLMAAVPNPMLYLDTDGQVAAANAAAQDLFGEWILQRNYISVLRQPPAVALVEAAYAQGKAGEARFVDADQAGQTLYRMQVSLVDAANITGLLLHFSDITHLREAEEMRRGFVANVSHELRTPLTAILGFIETLRGPARSDTDAQDRFLSIMEDEARRMNRIVSDLLSLSRVEGQERMRPDDPVQLDAILSSVAIALRLQAEDAGNSIDVEQLGTPVIVPGDKDQLMQVVMNLVENALKYGGPNRPVTLRLTKAVESGRLKGPVARIDVIDRGDGIDPVHLPRLTERFYRIDSHRSRAMGGTGLGLAIVKHIVNRHRGRLKIDSETGKGSTFTVTLPME